MRIKLTISYDGTAYCGWQRQLNGLSVQEVIENAILKLTGEKVAVTASGRTDSGVHAEGQVAHFDTNSSVPAEKFALALNALLPEDIKIVKSERAFDNFHARYTAKKKTYRYTFYVSDVNLPLKERYATRIFPCPDVEKMQRVANVLLGEHDFKCFLASGSEIKTTVRTIYSLDVKKSGDEITVTVCGNGFLYNMVRIIAGTLIKASDGEIDETVLQKALETGDRELVGKTAPAKGLCLIKVEYGENA